MAIDIKMNEKCKYYLIFIFQIYNIKIFGDVLSDFEVRISKLKIADQKSQK